MAEKKNAKKKKAEKPAPPPTARPKTETVKVSSPTVPLAQDTVQRFVDGLSGLRMTERQRETAERLRTSFGVIEGRRLGGTMDFDRSRGGGGAWMSYHDHELMAARDVLDMEQLFAGEANALKKDVIRLMVFEGVELPICAARKFGIDPRTGRPTRKDLDITSRALKEALDELARMWFGAPSRARVRIGGWRDPDMVQTTDETSVERGRGVHVTGKGRGVKIFPLGGGGKGR